MELVFFFPYQYMVVKNAVMAGTVNAKAPAILHTFAFAKYLKGCRAPQTSVDLTLRNVLESRAAHPERSGTGTRR